jgi:hypothetical protein
MSFSLITLYYNDDYALLIIVTKIFVEHDFFLIIFFVDSATLDCNVMEWSLYILISE